jgi:hypothetical protein
VREIGLSIHSLPAFFTNGTFEIQLNVHFNIIYEYFRAASGESASDIAAASHSRFSTKQTRKKIKFKFNAVYRNGKQIEKSTSDYSILCFCRLHNITTSDNIKSFWGAFCFEDPATATVCGGFLPVVKFVRPKRMCDVSFGVSAHSGCSRY